jgi:methionyl-tRNA formyltransferase
MTAEMIERMTRAFVPWPTAYTTLHGKMLKIFTADVNIDEKAAPREIYNITKNSFSVGTVSGGLVVRELQMEGKRKMAVADFLAGYKLSNGEFIG